MPQGKCKICHKKFYVKPSHLERGWGKYCSKKCQSKAQLKGKYINCASCMKKIWRTPADFRKSKSKDFFCSKSCQTIWRNKIYSGPKHSNWAGGESTYRKTLIENGIPQICFRCGGKDQRVLTVHHKNKDRKNNKIKNLIWLCLNCHYLVHRYNESIN